MRSFGAELFGVDVRTVNEHLKNIFESGELLREATIRKNRIVQQEGNRQVSRELDFYNLDAIISRTKYLNAHIKNLPPFRTGILNRTLIRPLKN